jgi:hypothetical protein
VVTISTVWPLEVTMFAAGMELVAFSPESLVHPMESANATAMQRKGTIRRINGFLLMFFTSQFLLLI